MDHLRVSDDQRERAAQALREHFAAGRLTQDELDERVQAVYRAQTEQDLRRLLVDLPQLPATPAQQHAELAARRAHLRRRLLQQAGGGLGVFVVLTVIWVAAGASGAFWPAFVLIATVLPLVRNGWRLYGPAPELDRVEQELARRERGRERDTRHAERYERRAERHERRHGR